MSSEQTPSQELIGQPQVAEQLAVAPDSALAAELRAAGRFAGDGFAGVVDRIHETHRAVSDRAFGAVGLVAAPIKVAHDLTAAVAYGSTREIGRAGLRLSGVLAGRAVPPTVPGAEHRTATRVWKGAINGLYGDQLESTGSELAMAMTPVVRGVPRPRVAVFIHGLCETEDAWFLHSDRGPAYGSRLRDELGYTPIYIRYNSGLPVDANGLQLALLLEQLLALWPVRVREVALIGHSMGGLVARSACGHATDADGMRWGRLVRHLVSLGTPHRGAPLEQTASVAARVLSWVPETRGLAGMIDARSVGIKDMGERMTVPYTPGIGYHFYSAGLSRGDADGQVTELLLGDLLVFRRSAWDIGRGESVRFGRDDYRHVSAASHFDLLAHPAVSDQLVRWLGFADSCQ